MRNINYDSILRPQNGSLRLKALIKKEFLQVIRDPSSILISIFLPLLLLFLYGYGVSLDLNHLAIGIVMEDTSPDAQAFLESLKGSRYFNPTIARDSRELVDDLISGKIRGIVEIPSYFSENRNRSDTLAPIFVIADGSETNTASFVKNYVDGAFQKWLFLESLKEKRAYTIPQATPEIRFWYNEQLESRNFLLPGSVALIMTLIGTLLTALVVSREWERGTMEALMSTPVSILELVLGKLIPYFIMGMLSMFLCVLVAVFYYHVPFRGSIAVLILSTAIFLICALGIGLLISTLSKNQVVASQIALITAFLPSYMLSGFIFEISSMPFYLQFITYFVPARYFVQILQTLFLVGNVWSLIFWNSLYLILFGVVIFTLTALKTVKRLD